MNKRKILQIISVSGYEALYAQEYTKDGESVGEDVVSEPVHIFALVEEDGEHYVMPLGLTDEDGGFIDFCDDVSNYKGLRRASQD